MRKVFTILSLLTFVSCKSDPKQESNKKEPKNWITISFETGDGEFILYNDGDSVIHKDWDYEPIKSDSGNGWFKEFKKVNERVERSKLTVAEKDSIYSWTSRLILTPQKPLRFCTDYVGYFKAQINLNRLPEINQTCDYRSICDWKIMNAESKALHQLLSTKFPKIK